jgi:CheY-like chemotaxis protein
MTRIFDAFEQGDASAWSRRAGGLGLGLAISRSIVEAHGGRLTAASDGERKGSTFTVNLAVARLAHTEEEPRTGGRAEGVPPCRGLEILLVEDDEPTVRVMARLLRQRGYVVRTAQSVAEALEVAGCGDFDLLVSDLGLPDGNGLELMERLRSGRQFVGIALSGFGQEGDVAKARDAGFSTHLTKPVDIQALETAILRHAR